MANPFLGEIKVFAGNFAPVGWATCSGQVLPISNHTALFSLLGTTYGGDGTQTFALPNLQGRALVHEGQGPGLSSYQAGATGGAETVMLTAPQLSAHIHSMVGNAVPATAPNPGTAVAMAAAPTGVPIYGSATGPVTLAPQAVTASGGGQPHENRQPFIAITYIIALQGIFPSRN